MGRRDTSSKRYLFLARRAAVGHTTTKSEHQVESGLLLDVVICQGATILELLASEDETLLVRRDALLVLDLRFHHVDGVGRLHLEGDGLAGKSLDEDLHMPSASAVATCSRTLHPNFCMRT